MRKYTIKELDDLRAVCRERWLFGKHGYKPMRTSRPYKEEELAMGVEAIVRTHMEAGHTAEDILKADA